MSRLRSSEYVRMDKYHDEQLYDILSARAKWRLDEDVITDNQLYRIADVAAGDARLAIGILRTAADKADRENHERITDDILLNATKDARAQIKQKSIDSLTPHQRVVYDTVREHGHSARARFTTTIRTRSTTRGRNGQSGPISRRWPSTTSSRPRARAGIENTQSLSHRLPQQPLKAFQNIDTL